MFTRRNRLDLGKDFFLYGLSFLLLMEWLLPLPHITDTGFIYVFVIVTAAYFIITFLQLPVWISVGIKVLLTIYGLSLVFYNGAFFSLTWFSLIFKDVSLNLTYMLEGQWYALTDLFRSTLFFVLLAIMSYLLFYWTIQARRILFFLVFTVIYVTVLDTFTIYDASFAIIRTFVIGFLLLGLVSMYRVIETEKLGSTPKLLPLRLSLMIVVMIVISTLFGFVSPKPEPQWADPVPYMRAAVGLGGQNGEAVQRIGYGNNDEQLGGGFIDDDTPVFYAAAKQGHYWRGETKDYYTGNGWDVTTPKTTEDSSRYDGMIHPALEIQRLEAEIAFAEESSKRYEQLFYPGELLSRDHIMNADLAVDRYTAKAVTSKDGNNITLSNYRFWYAYPTFVLEELRNLDGVDPEDIIDYYTQLPGNLPERVKELADELVAGKDNRYDRAKAIERYLASTEYTYETVDVPTPRRGEDYVDQFLFESKRGYCDNFSTAMVVLLRSIDIPARWVKGFTQGERVNTLSDGRDVYKVTNQNAHSWVEVYFPDIGWVPFEPTRGFTSTFDFRAPEVENTDPYYDSIEEEEEEAQPVFSDLDEEELEIKEEEEAGSIVANWSLPGGKWLFLSLLMILIIFTVIRNKKIVQLYLLRRFKLQNNQQTFLQAYERLLWFLKFAGHRRYDGETLREYAKRIDETLGAKDMQLITEEYERSIYGGKQTDLSWNEQKQRWERIVRKIIS
ncbi:transglutaminase TgpA family protein [Halalkalibacter urbisdiaboli]|uniref:transglutaminase TgpA family protein n=1 Tax=Halalkalibacter urbisdiaboli TaxID=1960589 RepID=UPI000B44AFFE|nr:transglutaminaseTgpA domain-containing protein [Halalkalibacter urbisdiaboli]